MKVYFLTCVLMSLCLMNEGRTQVLVRQSQNGFKLVVDGKDFMINGMNWDYHPIGTDGTYSLWQEPDDTIKSVLQEEMRLVKNMGVNALRIYAGIPRKWIAYIHKTYGIYTMLNHPFGRYGLSIDGAWTANFDYADPRVRELLIKETMQLAQDYKDTPGLLLYLLGNENNYGLFWEEEVEEMSREDKEAVLQTRAMYKLFLLNSQNRTTQNMGENASQQVTVDQKAAERAKSMYRLMNEAALAMKASDREHPIAICNGDLMFIDILKDECNAVDIFGTNVYRGISFGDTFQRVKQGLNKPILFTEVGADAYNAISNSEDQKSQAYYLIGNWKEIYANAAGMGGAENCIGGFTYQFSDGWWKASQTENLDVHDTKASWNNGGYYRDEKDGQNNMNEEWFGVCAKEPLNAQGAYELNPRAAYFVLKEAHRFAPYDSSATLVDLEKHFAKIEVTEAMKAAKNRQALLAE